MAGWMKTPLDKEVDRGPGHIYILDGVTAPAEGPAQQPPPSLRPMLWPRSPISATAELLNLVLLLTFVDYCILLMTFVMHLCSPCNRRTINISIIHDDDDDLFLKM